MTPRKKTTLKLLMIDGLVGNQYSELLCDGLFRIGADVRLIVPENRHLIAQPKFAVFKWAPSKDPQMSRCQKIIKYVKYLKKTIQYIYREKIDIIHYQFFRQKSELLFFLLLRALGKNVTITAHNVLPHEYHWSNFYYQRLLFRTASGVIAHSDFIKNKIIEQLRIPKQTISVIAHGSYEQVNRFKSISQSQARKNLELNDDDKVLLFFGYIKPYKGLDLLLDAFKIVADDIPDLKLIIAGSVESKRLKNFYEDKIKSMNIIGRIHADMKYIPMQDVPIYFVAADAVALPYRHIYHSGVVHLAFSFGKPIIATNVGDFREVIENGACGFTSEKNCAESYANTLRRAFSDRENLKIMGNFCRKISQTKYNWNTIAQKTLNFYHAIADYYGDNNYK